MPKQAVSVILSAEKRKTLEALASSRTAPYRQVQRARPILLAAEGMTNTAIAEEVDLPRGMVVQWRQRFIRDRLAGLVDRPRSGRWCTRTPIDCSWWRLRAPRSLRERLTGACAAQPRPLRPSSVRRMTRRDTRDIEPLVLRSAAGPVMTACQLDLGEAPTSPSGRGPLGVMPADSHHGLHRVS